MMAERTRRMKDVAAAINVYLKRFEADTKVNSFPDGRKTKPFYFAQAWAAGRYVGIMYVNYQGSTFLKREDAEKYLAFLDGGGIGKHWRALEVR